MHSVDHDVSMKKRASLYMCAAWLWNVRCVHCTNCNHLQELDKLNSGHSSTQAAPETEDTETEDTETETNFTYVLNATHVNCVSCVIQPISYNPLTLLLLETNSSTPEQESASQVGVQYL